MLWQLVEDHLYLDKLAELGDIERMDEILLSVTTSLERNPYIWPVSKINPKYHIASSDPSSCLHLVNVPELIIVYKIEEAEGRCILKWIEEAS